MMPVEATTPPIIVIGMHRSGTTLLTRMLEVCGVFWGVHKDEYNEAKSFQALNEKLFAMANCSWDNPEPVEALFADPLLANEAETMVRRSMDAHFFSSHLGWRWKPHHHPLSNFCNPWGWKDPRNIFTLPVWRRIFPRARIIHILRNGVDVAASLWRRETSRPEGFDHPHYSPRCQSLDGCFTLWKSYVLRARRHVSKIENAVEIRFEHLIEKPEATLHSLADFIGLQSDERLARAVSMIYPERRFAFINDSTIQEFRRRVENDELLAELGYCFLP